MLAAFPDVVPEEVSAPEVDEAVPPEVPGPEEPAGAASSSAEGEAKAPEVGRTRWSG